MQRISIVIGALGAVAFFQSYFRFTVPQVDFAVRTLCWVIPWFALGPILRLPVWGRRIGCFIVAPVLLLCGLMLTGQFFEALSWSRARLHEYSAKAHFDGYYVIVHEDCGGGATVSCTAWVFQERELLPGLAARRAIDSNYAFGDAHPEAVGKNRVRVRFGYTRDGPQERIYDLQPFTW